MEKTATTTSKPTRMLTLRGVSSVRQTGADRWDISFYVAPMTDAQKDMLARMFPNTLAQATELLDREILLSSIVGAGDLER